MALPNLDANADPFVKKQMGVLARHSDDLDQQYGPNTEYCRVFVRITTLTHQTSVSGPYSPCHLSHHSLHAVPLHKECDQYRRNTPLPPILTITSPGAARILKSPWSSRISILRYFAILWLARLWQTCGLSKKLPAPERYLKRRSRSDKAGSGLHGACRERRQDAHGRYDICSLGGIVLFYPPPCALGGCP